MLGSRLISGRGLSYLYGPELESAVDGVAGEIKSNKSWEINFLIESALGKNCLNLFIGSFRILGRIFLIDGREKINLHLK